MKTRNLFLRGAIALLAFFSTQQVGYSQCPNPINLISNSDFSSGFSGYTSSLAAATSNCQIDRYGIGTAFDDFCTSFPTTPNGTNMMVVDFHNSASGTMILQQGISGVVPGTNYTVGFRGASRNSSYDVPIDVYYSTYFIGTITINTAQAWGNYSLNWTAPAGAPASGNFRLEIGSQHIWNDFTLTDIQFSHCNGLSWRNTYENDKDHNHFSVAELENNEFVVAGTLYERGALTNTTFGARRFDGSGAILWQQEYFLNDAYDARCFDVSLAGSADKPILALTGYIQSSKDAPKQTFIMTLDPSDGSIIDYQEFTLDAYRQSTGLDLIYSAKEESYYVAGYQSEEILDVSGDKVGYVMSLDQGLNVNWVRLITSPASSSARNMANDLTEIEGSGIFVTGSINNTPIGTGSVSTLKVMLDYGGNVVWDLSSISTNSHECGVEAAYEPEEDALYVLSNNSVVHTFEIQRIDNASNAGASITMAGTNLLPNTLGNVAGFALSFDPNSSDLVVAGMIRNMPSAPVNTPTFIAKVDRSNFGVSALHYIRSNNAGYRDHDHDMFQAFYGQQALINYPDILGVFPSNFVILGYEGLSGYSLSVTRTDANGQTPSSKDCEESVEAKPAEIKPERVESIVKEQSAEPKQLDAYLEELKYKVYPDCEPLEIVAKKYSTGLSSVGSEDIKVYPNPVTELLNIEFPQTGNAQNVTVHLVDALGQTIINSSKEYAPGAKAKFDVSHLPEGVYFLSIRSSSYQIQRSVLVTH